MPELVAEWSSVNLAKEVKKERKMKKNTLEKQHEDCMARLWINFRMMLSPEERDAIGISEDRDMNINIVRLCTAYSDVLRENESLKDKIRQSACALI